MAGSEINEAALVYGELAILFSTLDGLGGVVANTHSADEAGRAGQWLAGC
jgi:hypothetical protein